MTHAARAWRFEPTVTSAREAAASGELGEWSQVFNRDPDGNVGIANGLLKDDYVYLLAELTSATLFSGALAVGPD